MLIEKDCYLLNREQANIITIKADLVCVDQEETKGNVVLASLVDAPAKLDKVKADYKKAELGAMSLLDENRKNVLMDNYNEYLRLNFLSFKGVEYNFSKKRFGNLAHMLISVTNRSPYIFKFSDDESLVDLIMNKLINIYFIPCKSDLVQEAILSNNKIIKEMMIFTNNDNLKHIKVYKFNKELFIKTINKISSDKGEEMDPIFNNFKGDFTGYINYFKPDILENLNSKIDEFYDENNVPEYVTQFPYPLPNKDMKTLLNILSNKVYKKKLSSLDYKETINIYETYKKMDKEGKITKTDSFMPNWSRQYVIWAASMKILETEKMLYLSLVMGAGKLK